jgi:hypothetical protein
VKAQAQQDLPPPQYWEGQAAQVKQSQLATSRCRRWNSGCGMGASLFVHSNLVQLWTALLQVLCGSVVGIWRHASSLMATAAQQVGSGQHGKPGSSLALSKTQHAGSRCSSGCHSFPEPLAPVSCFGHLWCSFLFPTKSRDT